MQTNLLYFFFGRNLTLLECSLLTAAVNAAGLTILSRNIRRSEKNERNRRNNIRC